MSQIKIKDVKPVNLTIGIILKRGISLQNIYELLVCNYISGYVFNGKHIPFFGINGVFVGAKHATYGSRGIRTQTTLLKGSMKNCISSDFQYFDRNFNVKIYKHIFHIGGLTSAEMGREIGDAIITNLELTQNSWLPFFEMILNERLNFIGTVLLPIITDNGKLLSADSQQLRDNFEAKKEELGNLANCVKLSIAFLEHPQYQTLDSFISKMMTIANLNVYSGNLFSLHGELRITSIKHIGGIYIGLIPFNNILLTNLVKFLLDSGENASFHNESSSRIRIISSMGLENYETRKTNSKIPVHQISITDVGGIRVNSPGDPDMVINETRRIIQLVCDFVERSIGIDDDMEIIQNRLKILLQKPEPEHEDDEPDFSENINFSQEEYL